ncbi:hypothetical protein C0033_04575 [Clostridium sp. chh4-2]|nr:hypothetical protein C0033_04575 [Clostridium sp. chh4-2]
MDTKIRLQASLTRIFVSIFPSKEPPMLLVWPQAMQEDSPSEQLPIKTDTYFAAGRLIPLL